MIGRSHPKFTRQVVIAIQQRPRQETLQAARHQAMRYLVVMSQRLKIEVLKNGGGLKHSFDGDRSTTLWHRTAG